MKRALKSMNEKKVTSNETDTPVIMESDLPLLDRNLYKTIKKMDRVSLESLINDIYESGRKKGAEEATTTPDSKDSNQENSCVEDTIDNHHTLDLRVLEKEIRSVKGIGEKRTEEIMLLIEKWLKLE